MEHIKLYEEFKKNFPKYYKNIETWFPNGSDAIRIRLNNGKQFIFMCNDNNEWTLESVKEHLKRMKGEK